MLLFPFYRWRLWATAHLQHLNKVNKEVKGRGDFCLLSFQLSPEVLLLPPSLMSRGTCTLSLEPKVLQGQPFTVQGGWKGGRCATGRIFRGKKEKRLEAVARMFSTSSGYRINYRLKTAGGYSEYPLGKAFQQTDTEIPENIAMDRWATSILKDFKSLDK